MDDFIQTFYSFFFPFAQFEIQSRQMFVHLQFPVGDRGLGISPNRSLDEVFEDWLAWLSCEGARFRAG